MFCSQDVTQHVIFLVKERRNGLVSSRNTQNLWRCFKILEQSSMCQKHSLTKLKSLYVDSTIKQILTKSTKLVMRYSKLGNLTRIQCHVRWMFWKSIPSMHLEKSTQSNNLSSFHRRTWLDR